MSQLTPQQKALHHAAFVTNSGDPDFHALKPLQFEAEGKPQSMKVPGGDVLFQFRKDVNEGKLPTVSWLTAPERFSDHPTSPWYGAWYVSEVMDILTKNPEVWKKTIFILTYDENDGYFDHAPSFVAADPSRPETGGASAGVDTALEYTTKEDELRQGVAPGEARSGPIGLGFRVPMIIVSPWSRGGYVNSQVFDHTSTLQFLERFVAQKYGKTVREENISDWRRVVCGDLTSVFRPYNPKDPSLDFLNRDKYLVSIEKARYKELPSNYKQLTAEQIAQVNRAPRHTDLVPQQEAGIRPACALPYELRADGGLTSDGGSFELRLTAGNQLHGSAAAGAPFNVYLRNTRDRASAGFAASFAVKPGDTLTRRYPLASFTNSNYSVEVHGPNGFYRSFSGSPDASQISLQASHEQRGSRFTGNLQLHLRNDHEKPMIIVITDNAYNTSAVTKKIDVNDAAAVVLPLVKSHGWYDFTVKATGSNAEARFAGRVETGKATYTDPLMGASSSTMG